MNKYVISIVVFGFCFACKTETGEKEELESEVTPPAVVLQAFTRDFSRTADAKWVKEDEAYEVNFSLEQHAMSATYDEVGTLLETEAGIAVEELPGDAKQYLGENYKAGELGEVVRVTKPGAGEQYEVSVAGKEIVFDTEGHPIQPGADEED